MNTYFIDSVNSPKTYNLGGVAEIWLLNISDFNAYKFKDDNLYENCYVDAIDRLRPFSELGAVDETVITSTYNKNVYEITLKTFVRSLNAYHEENLLKLREQKLLVCIRSMQERCFTFGSDGGAILNYTPQIGRLGEVHGYNIEISKKSIFPLFELNPDALTSKVLGSESMQYITTENSHTNQFNYIIEIP